MKRSRGDRGQLGRLGEIRSRELLFGFSDRCERAIAAEGFEASLRLLEAGMTLSSQLYAFLVCRQRIFEGELGGFELSYDPFEPCQEVFEGERFRVLHRSSGVLPLPCTHRQALSFEGEASSSGSGVSTRTQRRP